MNIFNRKETGCSSSLANHILSFFSYPALSTAGPASSTESHDVATLCNVFREQAAARLRWRTSERKIGAIICDVSSGIKCRRIAVTSKGDKMLLGIEIAI